MNIGKLIALLGKLPVDLVNAVFAAVFALAQGDVDLARRRFEEAARRRVLYEAMRRRPKKA